MAEVSKDSFFNFRQGRETDLWQIRRWIGRIKLGRVGSATCILVAPRVVVTPMHAVEGLINSNRLDGITIQFGNYPPNDGSPNRTVTTVELDPLNPVLATSPSSPFDRGSRPTPPEDGRLDYAALVLDRDFGYEKVNEEPRGWLSLPDDAVLENGSEGLMMSYPDTEELGESAARFERSDIPDRINHTCTSLPGSSGGLLLSVTDQGEYVPLAMHLGGNRRENNEYFNFGVQLSKVRENLSSIAPRTFGDVASPIHRLKIAIVAGRPDGDEVMHEMLQKFFQHEEVMTAFSDRNFSPWIRDSAAENISRDDIIDLYQNNPNIEQLHNIAKSDIAFVFVSKRDADQPETRDKLMAAYGFLCARLGTRRVHLFHRHDVNLSQARNMQNDDFVHIYEHTFLDLSFKKHVGNIADLTRNHLEDDVQGLFEVGRVVLPWVRDDHVFESRDFNAEHTLHILGFRFGRLKYELQNILSTIEKKSSRVVIAFPNYAVSLRNPYLHHLLQSGGDDTEQFLLKSLEIAQSNLFDQSVLERVSFIAIDHIPTFVMTGADLWYTEGRMLISPAFPRGKNQPKLDNPRLLLHNKLSHHGVYNAYRSVLEQFINNSDTSKQSWTLAEAEALTEYVDDMQKAFRTPP